MSNEEKKTILLDLLQNTSSVFIHLDPRPDGVTVPTNFKYKQELVLQIGLNMAVPIHDLGIDELAIQCTLSFGGKPCFCRVPWESVNAVVDGESGGAVVWNDKNLSSLKKRQTPKLGPEPKKKKATTRFFFSKKKKEKLVIPPYLKVIK